MDRSPSRRAFAALAVPLLAGCVSVPDSGPSNDGGPNGDDHSSDGSSDGNSNPSNCARSIESPDPYPDVRIEMDDVPEAAEASICVMPIEPFSDESPARIAFELTNESDASVEYGFGVSPPYGGVWAEQRHGEAGLYLVPDYREHVVPGDGLVPAEPTDGCWRAQSSLSVEDIGLLETVDPGATIREEYTLLAATEGECLARGTYRSEEAYYDPVPGGWGFEITLSR